MMNDSTKNKPAQKNKNFKKIGSVSKELNIHEQTIREYDKRGLVNPTRSPKNIRYFSQKDILRLTIITILTSELHLSLAGVKLVLSLTKKVKMNDDELIDFVKDHIADFVD